MTEEQLDIILIRGKFIDLTIDIESIMDDILAFHFCSVDKYNQFKRYILEDIMFNKKKDIFQSLLKEKYSELYNQYADYIDVSKLKDTRNKFAHNRVTFHVNKNGKTDRTKLTFYKSSDDKPADTIEISHYEKQFEFFKEQLSAFSEIFHKMTESR